MFRNGKSITKAEFLSAQCFFSLSSSDSKPTSLTLDFNAFVIVSPTKTENRGEISLTIDFTKDLITLPELCESFTRVVHESHLDMVLPSYVYGFRKYLEQCTSEQQHFACARFMNGHSFNDLYGKYPEIIDECMSILCNEGKGVEVVRTLLEDYAECFAQQMTTLPALFLTELDFSEADHIADYQTVSFSKKFGIYNGPYERAHIEGYWIENYVNQDVYKFAEEKTKSGKLSTDDLREIRQFIISKEQLGERRRYPLPQPYAWNNKEALIKCLQLLKKMARQIYVLRSIMRLRIPEQMMDGLLHLNMHKIQHRGWSSQRLPINYDGILEYAMQMPNKELLVWPAALTKYIETYNIVPSKDFLRLMTAFLQDCRTKYLDAANQLKEYLASHPVELHYPGKREIPTLLVESLFRNEAFLAQCQGLALQSDTRDETYAKNDGLQARTSRPSS